MTQTKFTKTKWIIDIYSSNGQVDVISDCGRKTLHCNKRYFGQGLTSEDIANAHLIAAAPEIYDVLASIENDGDQVPVWLWDKIQSTLAKARGENV